MDIATVALLAGAGLVGGVANAIAGGATLITFPAMLASGIPPIIANASNAVAMLAALIRLFTSFISCAWHGPC